MIFLVALKRACSSDITLRSILFLESLCLSSRLAFWRTASKAKSMVKLRRLLCCTYIYRLVRVEMQSTYFIYIPIGQLIHSLSVLPLAWFFVCQDFVSGFCLKILICRASWVLRLYSTKTFVFCYTISKKILRRKKSWAFDARWKSQCPVIPPLKLSRWWKSLLNIWMAMKKVANFLNIWRTKMLQPILKLA